MVNVLSFHIIKNYSLHPILYKFNSTSRANIHAYIQKMSSIYEYLEKEYDAKVVRCEIIKMHANSHIPDHIDSGEFLYLGRRIHIPLITNKDVIFTIFGNSINMEVGKWYDINNSLPHSVDNNSIYDRIHIIIDLIENKYMNEKR